MVLIRGHVYDKRITTHGEWCQYIPYQRPTTTPVHFCYKPKFKNKTKRNYTFSKINTNQNKCQAHEYCVQNIFVYWNVTQKPPHATQQVDPTFIPNNTTFANPHDYPKAQHQYPKREIMEFRRTTQKYNIFRKWPHMLYHTKPFS